MTPITLDDTSRAAGADGDMDAVRALLVRAGLPLDGLDGALVWVVARDAQTVVGSAALEEYAGGALLRSVVVAEHLRGSGVGRRLTHAALDLARRRGHRHVYLLTTSAESFFASFGFQSIDRAAVPADVRQSIEFTTACPASATAMVL